MVVVFIHNMVTKRPKVQGREKGGMKWSDDLWWIGRIIIDNSYVASVQYVVSFLFASVCYFLITLFVV